MKLSKVNITNFRCFESLSIHLEKDLNVFVGANGSGKSSILDAIAIALYSVVAANSDTQSRKRELHKTTLKEIDIHIDSVTRETSDFVHIEAQSEDFYPLKGFSNKTSSGETVYLEWDERIEYELPSGPKYSSSLTNSNESLKLYFREVWNEIKKTSDKALITLPVIAYYRSERRASKKDNSWFTKFSFNRQGAYKNALNAGTEYQSMRLWFYERENSELRERQLQGLDSDFEYPDLRAVRLAIKQMFDNVERIFFGDNGLDLKIQFKTESENPDEKPAVMMFDQLSDGYQNLLAITMDFARRLAQANPAWDNPLEAPGILLIDEIELHLHPKWQQTVIPNLQKAFPNTQIIVTTHSPQVLTTVESKNITILKDFKLYASPVHTYGAESKRLMKDIMGTDSRPPDNEISKQILNLFKLINDDELEKASELCDRLFDKLGIDEPALVEAKTIIKNRQWEKELGI